MKKLFSVFLILLLCCSFASSVLAADGEEIEIDISNSESEDSPLPDAFPDEESSDEDLYLSDVSQLPDGFELSDISVTSVITKNDGDVDSQETNGLKSVILGLIGDYSPTIINYEYTKQGSNYTQYAYIDEVQPDYTWMASFLLFSLVIYCLFRLGGALID